MQWHGGVGQWSLNEPTFLLSQQYLQANKFLYKTLYVEINLYLVHYIFTAKVYNINHYVEFIGKSISLFDSLFLEDF